MGLFAKHYTSLTLDIDSTAPENDGSDLRRVIGILEDKVEELQRVCDERMAGTARISRTVGCRTSTATDAWRMIRGSPYRECCAPTCLARYAEDRLHDPIDSLWSKRVYILIKEVRLFAIVVDFEQSCAEIVGIVDLVQNHRQFDDLIA